jgi:hypothetical protein
MRPMTRAIIAAGLLALMALWGGVNNWTAPTGVIR